MDKQIAIAELPIWSSEVVKEYVPHGQSRSEEHHDTVIGQVVSDQGSLFGQVFAERKRLERNMTFRHPWVPLTYNWVIAILIICIGISMIGWVLDIRTDRIASERAATAMSAYQAELKAEEDARAQELAAQQASETAVIEREATAIAKMFYGIRLFIDKYHYSERDLETYARCPFNRKDAGSKLSLEEIIAQKDQFTGYFDNNPVLKEYEELARKFVTAWHEETVKPCDTSYQWAELTPDGIFLKNDINADGYSRRYHA